MSKPISQYQTFEEFEKEIDYEPSAYERIVVQIACERVRKGLTQEQLADIIGTTQSVISRFENLGRKPSLEFVERIAKALGHKLGVSIFGEYMPEVKAEFIESVDSVAEKLDETTSQVVDRVYNSCLRHLTECIKWTKVDTHPPAISFAERQDTRVDVKSDILDDESPRLRGYAG